MSIQLEELGIYMRDSDYVIRYSAVGDEIFYYAHMNGEKCSATPYNRASDAIDWADDEAVKNNAN